METINKSQLIAAAAEKANVSKAEAKKVLDAAIEALEAELVKGNRVAVFGMGSFEVKERKARTGMNPLTKEKIEIPASKAVGFKAAKALKVAVNPPKPAKKAAKKSTKKAKK